MQFPLLFTQTSVEFRLVGDHVYAEAADISSGKWLEINEHPPSFFGIALELTQPGPDLQLIKGFRSRDDRRRAATPPRANFSSNEVAADQRTQLTASKTVLGSLDVTVTTGRERRGDRRHA